MRLGSLSILFILMLTLLSCSSWEIRSSMPFVYEISENPTFNLDNSSVLHFGGGPYGSKVERVMDIQNNFDTGHIFQLVFEGGGRSAVYVYPSNIWYLEPNQTRSFKIELILLDNQTGSYNGTLHVYSRPGYRENKAELLSVPYPFVIESVMSLGDYVFMCSEKYPVKSSDLNFQYYDYWRSILRC